jgi:hypothetical protein
LKSMDGTLLDFRKFGSSYMTANSIIVSSTNRLLIAGTVNSGSF